MQIDIRGPYVTPELNYELQCNVGNMWGKFTFYWPRLGHQVEREPPQECQLDYKTRRKQMNVDVCDECRGMAHDHWRGGAYIHVFMSCTIKFV